MKAQNKSAQDILAMCAKFTREQALVEILGLEALADCEEDLDNDAKAKRLRKTARALREHFHFVDEAAR